jgi:hypothetical protein
MQKVTKRSRQNVNAPPLSALAMVEVRNSKITRWFDPTLFSIYY